MAKFFIYPFATAGDKTAIPDLAQVDGSVSYQAGFTSDYQLVYGVDLTAKAVPRYGFNELMYDTTLAIQQYQTNGTPDFITTVDNLGAAYPYYANALVRYDDGVIGGTQLYTSLVNGNTALPTDTTKWAVITKVANVAQVVMTTTQVIPALVRTLIQFDNTPEFDPQGMWSGAPNYRFTPKRPGKYLVYGSILTNPFTTGGQSADTTVWKNGVEYKTLGLNIVPLDGSGYLNGTCLVSMNGTTDYVDLRVLLTSAGQHIGVGTTFSNYFGIAYQGPS